MCALVIAAVGRNYERCFTFLTGVAKDYFVGKLM